MKILPSRRRGTASSTDVERDAIARLVRAPLFELIPLRERARASGCAARRSSDHRDGVAQPRHRGDDRALRRAARPRARGHATPRGAHVPRSGPRRRAARPMPIRGDPERVRGGRRREGSRGDPRRVGADPADGGPGSPVHVDRRARLPGRPSRRSRATCSRSSLRAKQAHADHVTTQMGFDPDAIATWIVTDAQRRHHAARAPRTPRRGDVRKLHDGRRQDRRRPVPCAICGSTGACLGHVLKRSFGPDALLEAPRAHPGRSRCGRPRAASLHVQSGGGDRGVAATVAGRAHLTRVSVDRSIDVAARTTGRTKTRVVRSSR